MMHAAPVPALNGASSLAPWQTKRTLTHIEENLDGPIRVRDLASLVRLSYSHYGRAFRETFGRTPRLYILACRIAQAQALMLETGDALSAIALACGFCDQAHLSRVFRRLVGQSPNAWRRTRRYDA